VIDLKKDFENNKKNPSLDEQDNIKDMYNKFWLVNKIKEKSLNGEKTIDLTKYFKNKKKD